MLLLLWTMLELATFFCKKLMSIPKDWRNHAQGFSTLSITMKRPLFQTGLWGKDPFLQPHAQGPRPPEIFLDKTLLSPNTPVWAWLLHLCSSKTYPLKMWGGIGTYPSDSTPHLLHSIIWIPISKIQERGLKQDKKALPKQDSNGHTKQYKHAKNRK